MKENLSQRKLLEVLTHEIEVLRKTSVNINEVAPTIDNQLKNLKQVKLEASINLNPLEILIKGFERSLKHYMVIPRWFMITTIVVFVIVAIQSAWLYLKVFAK